MTFAALTMPFITTLSIAALSIKTLPKTTPSILTISITIIIVVGNSA